MVEKNLLHHNKSHVLFLGDEVLVAGFANEYPPVRLVVALAERWCSEAVGSLIKLSIGLRLHGKVVMFHDEILAQFLPSRKHLRGTRFPMTREQLASVGSVFLAERQGLCLNVGLLTEILVLQFLADALHVGEEPRVARIGHV